MSFTEMNKGDVPPNKNGKMNKGLENKKKAKNEEIEGLIMKYYLSEMEMPQYVANLANSISERYALEKTQMAAHIGLITANMKQMEKAIISSKLSKGSQREILQWVDMFNTEKES